MRYLRIALLAVAFASASAACGDDESGDDKSCEPDSDLGCTGDKVCEEVEGGQPACFDPVVVEGRVFDLVSTQGIANARVLARDENQTAVSPIATSDANGAYRLSVPSKRDASGNPTTRAFTLRADASGYQGFPTPPRVALPLDLKDATGDPGKVLKSVATDVGLVALPDTAGLGSVSGTVETDQPGGTLVIAGGATGVADRDGTFTIFNVPAGSQTVAGYQQGINLGTASANVSAGQEAIGVVLSEIGKATATVSRSVQIVNASGGSSTSVILVLEDTFDAALIRGEAPPGLRAGDVSGAFSISGVPDGRYVVLAAFENDGLVRDPDTSIGGTDVVHITVAGSNVTAGEGFKVTGALAVVSPGANDIETVSGTPTFVWQDDSSEDEYHVTVYDALGALIWETTGNFDQGGGSPAEVAYGGPALTAGMIYQFRATSIKDGTPISSTEDLKGVFVSQ